jgi:dihydrofolate reductase
MIGSIWCQTRAGVIGRDRKIPWRYPGDSQRFKRVTMGAAVVMGRITWESIGSRPLPGRRNVVVSVTMPRAPGIDQFVSVDQFMLENDDPHDVWFIGGRRIYEAAMRFVDLIDVTYVPDDIPIDGSVVLAPVIRSEFAPHPEVQHEYEPTLYNCRFDRVRPS